MIGIEIDGSSHAPDAREIFRHRAERTDIARGLMLLGNDLDTELRKKPVDVVVIRALDWSPRRRENVVRPRLQVEGVLLLVSRRIVPTVIAWSGKEIGDQLGQKKEQVEQLAAELMPNLDRDAAVAALAALSLRPGV